MYELGSLRLKLINKIYEVKRQRYVLMSHTSLPKKKKLFKQSTYNNKKKPGSRCEKGEARGDVRPQTPSLRFLGTCWKVSPWAPRFLAGKKSSEVDRQTVQ